MAIAIDSTDQPSKECRKARKQPLKDRQAIRLEIFSDRPLAAQHQNNGFLRVKPIFFE